MSRIMAIDPGEAHLGLAISDPLRVVARPLEVVSQSARDQDARKILQIAHEQDVSLLLVGVPYDQEGKAGSQARKSLRLAALLKELGSIPVETWDESYSTQIARRKVAGRSPIDAHAAAVFLQDYLDAKTR